MRVICSFLALVAAANAFCPLQQHTHPRAPPMALQASTNNHHSPLEMITESTKQASKAVAAALLAGALWAAPAAVTNVVTPHSPITAVASAKEMASGSGSRVNKDPDSLLRYGLPINNKEVSAACYVSLCEQASIVH